MDEQFITYGSAEVMVANVTLKQAAELRDQIADVKGVQMISYDETSEHYNNLSALYSITFDYSEDDPACLDSLDAVKELLSAYDVYVKTDLGNSQGGNDRARNQRHYGLCRHRHCHRAALHL